MASIVTLKGGYYAMAYLNKEHINGCYFMVIQLYGER